MAFRSNEYLQRNELVRFQLDDVIRAPANGQHQQKGNYKFTINDRSAFYDWFNGYLEVQFQLQKTADGAGYAAADRITVLNGSHSLIKHLTIRSAGKIIYDTDNLHKVCFVKNLLEYSDDFSRSVAKNSFWYLDTDTTTANTNAGFEARRLQTQAVQNNGNGGAKNINVIIPLNRFSFFEKLEDKMLVPMQLQFEIALNDDGELIHMANGTDAGRVVVNRFLLWVPRLTPKDSLADKFVSSFMKETQWKYLREMYQQSAPASLSLQSAPASLSFLVTSILQCRKNVILKDLFYQIRKIFSVVVNANISVSFGPIRSHVNKPISDELRQRLKIKR